jgi:hypothetical protein
LGTDWGQTPHFKAKQYQTIPKTEPRKPDRTSISGLRPTIPKAIIRTRNAQAVGSNPTVGSKQSQAPQGIAGFRFTGEIRCSHSHSFYRHWLTSLVHTELMAFRAALKIQEVAVKATDLASTSQEMTATTEEVSAATQQISAVMQKVKAGFFENIKQINLE